MGVSMVFEDRCKTENLRTEKQKKAIYAMLPYFENVVILGDSLAESLMDFRLLRKNNVIAKRGRCIDMIDDDMKVVIKLEPRVLFMEFGKNDVHHFQGNCERFITIYKEKLHYLQKHLPNTVFYVNSIIPFHPSIMMKNNRVELHNKFNSALKSMCEEEHIDFIDNSSIMEWTDDIFEYDGLHPKYPYYPKWLLYMARKANLIDENL